VAVVAVPEVAAEVVVVLASVAVAEVGVVPASAAAVEQPVCLRPVFRPLAVA
jgi:hypothetical protein